MSISGEDMKTLLRAQQGELDAVLMYNALADAVKDKNDAQTFRQLASEEGHHAAVFRNITNQTLNRKRLSQKPFPFSIK